MGIFLSLFQMVKVIPLIHEAESYEEKAGHHHTSDEAHRHEEKSNSLIQSDLSRKTYTFLANILTATGFAFLMTGVFFLGKTMNWLKGLGVGLLAYLSFVLAPSLIIPPNLPGIDSGDVLIRQAWWFFTVLSTATGLGLLVFFYRKPLYIVIAIVLVILPHLVGGSQIQIHANNVPERLVSDFLAASLVTNLFFWLCEGGLTGYLYERFILRGRS